MSVMTAGFHGRTAELDTLRSLIEGAAAGRGGIVLIDGEAGLGESRLLIETTTAATDAGLEVATGAARQLERDRPFGALMDALELRSASSDPTRTELLGLLNSADTSSDLRFRIAELIVDIVEARSLHTPLLLALEDLHWSDPSTLMVLDRLVALVPTLPVALVLTFRPTPRRDELSAVIASATESGATEMALAPLDDDAVQALVSSLVRAGVGANLERGVRAAGGNPLFVTELVSALDQEGLLTRSNDTADATGAALPPSLRLTILRRLAFLPRDCLKILKVASVLGSSFSLHDLSTANTQTPLDLFELLEPALASGLVVEAADALSFKHDLVRDAVYYDLPESARRSFHRDIATKLAAADASAQQVAAHMSLGAATGDREAVEWLRRAATEAGARAPTITVELLERALELAAADDPDRDAIEIELVEALVRSGQVLVAQTRGEDILKRRLTLDLEVRIRQKVGEACMLQRDIRAARDHYRRGAEIPGIPERERMRFRALVLYAQMEPTLDAWTEGEREAEELYAWGEAHEDDVVRIFALYALGACWWARAQHTKAAALMREAVRLAMRTDEGLARDWQPPLALGSVLTWMNEMAEAESVLREGLRGAESQMSYIPVYHVALGDVHFTTGAWDEAVAEFETCLGLLTSSDTTLFVREAYYRLADIVRSRGDVAAAEALLLRDGPAPLGEGEGSAALGDDVDRVFTWMMLRETQGRIAEAVALARAVMGDIEGLPVFAGWMASEVVRVLLRGGQAQDARRLTEATREIARDAPSDELTGCALYCTGLLDDDPQALSASADAFREAGMPLRLGVSLEALGESLVRKGDLAAAVPTLEEAIRVYEQLGATLDISRTEAILRSAGVRRGKRGRRTRPQTGWESLTETETQVVGMVAGGLTNAEIAGRLFISKRTVETHVSHLFRKLGVQTRVELATLALREGPVQAATS